MNHHPKLSPKLSIDAVPAPLPGDWDWSVALRMQPPGGWGTPVVLAAGPSRGGLAVTALRDRQATPLWEGPDDGAAPDLVPLGDRLALALLPGRALLRLDPFAEDPAAACRDLRPGKRLPDRLYAVAGRHLALALKDDGRTILSELRPSGASVRGTERPGPTLLDGQEPGLLVADAAGRLVLTADDPARGFHLWRESPGGWDLLVSDGAGRFGFDARLASAARWQGRLALATGPGWEVRENLLGMRIASELLLLGDDGSLALLSGELRTGQGALMVPRLAAKDVRTLSRGRVARLCAQGDMLALVHGQEDGWSAVHAIAPDLSMTRLGLWPGPIAVMEPGEFGLVVLGGAEAR